MPACFSEQGGSQDEAALLRCKVTRRNSMARLTKKQQQLRFIEEFLRRSREAAPGERLFMQVGDLFASAELHDLGEERNARRAVEDHAQDVGKCGDK
jgi:hypothetical protein